MPCDHPRLEILHELHDMPQALVEHRAVASVVAWESRHVMPDRAALREPGGPPAVEAAMARWRRAAERRELQLQDAWQDDHVLVDGRHVAARRVAGEHAQAVVFEYGPSRIAVSATGVELSGLEMTTTQAIEPLLDDMTRRAALRS